IALLLLGARRVSGSDVTLTALGLADRVARVDLVVTGEGRFDASSLRGKAPAALAALAREAGVPCLVLAGQLAVGREECAAHGIQAAYALVDIAGSVARATARPARWLAATAARAAREWCYSGPDGLP
ncbi:MAG: glycerate kinase, partial [Mycobacteriales bacterium]